MLGLCPFSPEPYCFLNAVVEDEMRRVLVDDHLRPLGTWDNSRTWIVGTDGGGRSVVGSRGWMAGIARQRVSGNTEAKWTQAIRSQVDRSDSHRVSKMREVYRAGKAVSVAGGIDRTTFG